jgi:hypothetical protein
MNIRPTPTTEWRLNDKAHRRRILLGTAAFVAMIGAAIAASAAAGSKRLLVPRAATAHGIAELVDVPITTAAFGATDPVISPRLIGAKFCVGNAHRHRLGPTGQGNTSPTSSLGFGGGDNR